MAVRCLRPLLRKALGAVMQHYQVKKLAVTVVLTDDPSIQQLKLQHWGEDRPTDVLSFPSWQPSDPFMPPHLGDIIISLDTAQRQADARGHSLEREVLLLASHGFTHLMGYEHPHADGLGYEEGATGEEWAVFHSAAEIAYAVIPAQT